MSSARPATQATSGTVDIAALRRRFVRLGKPAAPQRQARVRPRLAITVLGMLDDNESTREDALLTQLLDEQELQRPLAIHTVPDAIVPPPAAESTDLVEASALAVVEVEPAVTEAFEPTIVTTENIAAALTPVTVNLVPRGALIARTAPAQVVVPTAVSAAPSWPSISDAPTLANAPIVAPGWPAPVPPRAAAPAATPAANEPIYTVGLRPAIGTSFPMTITPYRAVYEGS